MFHTLAFFTNGDFGNADTYLGTVADQSVYRETQSYRVPDGRTFLLAEAFTTAAATRTYARVETPSLRPLSNQYVPKLGGAAQVMTDDLVNWHPYSPRELQAQEQLQFLANTDDAAAQDHVGAVWLGDGPVQPVTGKIFTTRATAAFTQVVQTWQSGVLTIQERLPVTDYQIVGMRVQAGAGSLARLIFPDSPYRPGVILNSTTNAVGLDVFRFGRMGVFGQFNVNQPPQLEVFGGNSSAQTVHLDLIRVK